VPQLGAEVLRAILLGYREALGTHAGALDRLNVFPVPDSDTGTNLLRTMDAVVGALPPAGADLPAVCGAVTEGALLGARGNSGVILSQVLRGLTGALPGDGLAAALVAAATAARRAVLEPVEGTVLTVADAAAVAVAAVEGTTPVEVLEAARAAAAEALARTPEQLPVLAEAGVVDAGGAGFLLLLDAALAVVDGRPVPAPPAGAPVRPLAVTGPRYEVTYLLEAPADRVEDLRHRLGGLGESVAVSGGDGRWSCHVHTDDPDAAVAAGSGAGIPTRVEVVDLTRSGLQNPPQSGGFCRPEG
jgi:dihydroxyacetone kinase-like predicted kinase